MKRRDSSPIPTDQVQELVIGGPGFDIFVSGSAVGRCKAVVGSQLDTLRASLATAADLWIEQRAEGGEAGAEDGYIDFDDGPDAGLDIGPWCYVSLICRLKPLGAYRDRGTYSSRPTGKSSTSSGPGRYLRRTH